MVPAEAAFGVPARQIKLTRFVNGLFLRNAIRVRVTEKGRRVAAAPQ